MKRLAGVTLLFAIVTGCDSDRLAKLEKQNTALGEQLASLQKSNQLELQSKCAKDAKTLVQRTLSSRQRNDIPRLYQPLQFSQKQVFHKHRVPLHPAKCERGRTTAGTTFCQCTMCTKTWRMENSAKPMLGGTTRKMTRSVNVRSTERSARQSRNITHLSRSL